MGWHGPRGECGCCGDISSSSSTPSSSIISSSSSVSSSSSIVNPCDCGESGVTYYVKITINHPQEFETYSTQGFAPGNCPICRLAARTAGFTNATGTYFIPLIRNCSDPSNIEFVLGSGTLLTVNAGNIETAACNNGVYTWSVLGPTSYTFNRRSSTLNQLLDITYVRAPFNQTGQIATIDVANLNLCKASPVLSGSHTWASTVLTLPNVGGNFGDPCSVSTTHNFEPLLWEIVPGEL